VVWGWAVPQAPLIWLPKVDVANLWLGSVGGSCGRVLWLGWAGMYRAPQAWLPKLDVTKSWMSSVAGSCGRGLWLGCVQVKAQWRPSQARKPKLKEAPTLHPTEEVQAFPSLPSPSELALHQWYCCLFC